MRALGYLMLHLKVTTSFQTATNSAYCRANSRSLARIAGNCTNG